MSKTSDSNSGLDSITHCGYKISTKKLPILKAEPIEEMSNRLGIQPPEMIFGDNYVKIEHIQTGWNIEFNAFDALDKVDKTGQDRLQVSYSKEWQSTRQKVHEDIKEVIKPFDWSYTTDYKGTVNSINNTDNSTNSRTTDFVPTNKSLPIALLSKPDPILFFSNVDLFEDELADNGMSILTVKIRVMPKRLLLLSRFFLRLDDVIIRIFDTRVYVEFENGLIIREYMQKEDKYDAIKSKIHTIDDATSIMRDADQLSKILSIKNMSIEEIYLPTASSSSSSSSSSSPSGLSSAGLSSASN